MRIIYIPSPVGCADRFAEPTYFSFPARHHSLPGNLPATFTAAFQKPSGLHPKLQIHLTRQYLTPPRDDCGLYTYMTLPSTLFIDRYQFSDHLFLDAQNLVALRSLIGEDDLEAPDWVVTRWGSAALLQIATPPSPNPPTDTGEDWTVTIPLHLRYMNGPQRSTDSPDEATVALAWPVVFWACDTGKDVKLSNNPFDRVDLGYDELFDPQTTFYHIPPANNVTRLVEEIRMPVLHAENAEWVQTGTLITVVAGFLWICWQLSKAIGSGNITREKYRKVQ